MRLNQRIAALTLVPLILSGCDQPRPLIELTCSFVEGSGGDQAKAMNVQIDLNEPRVSFDDGIWIYKERPTDGVYGEDTISIRQLDDTGEIVMGAIRADVPALLRFNPANGTMHYAYAGRDGNLYRFIYHCEGRRGS